MKIGIVCDCIDDGAMGLGRTTGNLANNLTAIDRKNEYVMVHHNLRQPDFYRGKKELIVPIKKIPMGRELRKIIELPAILESAGVDLVHDTGQIGPFFFKKKFKKVVTINDLSTLRHPETHVKMNYIRHKYGMPAIIKNVDKITVLSENTKRDLMEIFNVPEDKIRVIYIGVEDRFKVIDQRHASLGDFRRKYSLPYKFILTLSTLEPRKNIITLIKAFHKLKRKYSVEHKLLIAGSSGWKYSGIFGTVRELGLENDIIFTGYIPDEELPEIYNLADVFAFPSLYEGFGLPPLEAMACGCPVVTSNTSSLPEVVGDAGIMVSPLDVDGLAKGIYDILNNGTLKESLIYKGLQRAKMFDWKKNAQETLAVYEEVMRGK